MLAIVLDERLGDVAVGIVAAYCPNLRICGDGSYPVQGTVAWSNIRAGDNTPAGTIPLFGEGLIKAATLGGEAPYSPDIRRGNY